MPTRITRNHTGPGSYQGLVSGVVASTTPEPGFEYDLRVETITDSPAKRAVERLPTGQRFERPRYCKHTVNTHNHVGATKEYKTPDQNGTPYSHKTTNWAAYASERWPNEPHVVAPNLPGDSSFIPWDEMSHLAWEYMKPSMSAGAPSLLNFLAELDDIRRLSDLTKLRFLRDKSVNYRRAQTARYMAGAHLSWSFGVKPFVNDVLMLGKALIKFQRNFANLVKGAGKPQRAHYSRLLTQPPLEAISVTGDGRYRAQRQWLNMPSYHASAYYRYEVPKDVLAMVGSLLDSLGVRVDFSTLWNAIPFSFVVDWFVNVGEFLSQYSMDNNPVTVELLDFCHSVKFSSMAIREVSPPQSGVWLPIWTAKSEYYERRVTIPVFGTPLVANGPFGFDQLLLSSSLVTTRVIPKPPTITMPKLLKPGHFVT